MASTSNNLNLADVSFIGLPSIILQKTLTYLSYEELSYVRATCRTFRSISEDLLNSGFSQLGREVEKASAFLRRHLPRRESARRAHRLNSYAEIYSALEARYTLLSMAYKKFIECGYCCFIPGKVLDEAFKIIRRLNKEIEAALKVENQNQRLSSLNSIELLKDFKDFSSMAMEHFDEQISIRFPNKYMLALNGNRRLSDPFPYRNLNTNKNEKTILTVQPNKQNIGTQFELFKADFNRRLNEQSRMIKDQDKLIKEQGETIARILSLLNNDLATLTPNISLEQNTQQQPSQFLTTNKAYNVVELITPTISNDLQPAKKSYNLRKRVLSGSRKNENLAVKKPRIGRK